MAQYDQATRVFLEELTRHDIASHISETTHHRHVHGSVEIRGDAITELPDGLHIHGHLSLQHSRLQTLPENLTVTESLHIDACSVAVLPDSLAVHQNLWMCNSPITALPPGFQVGGSLFLAHADVTVLPERLRVGRDLDLQDTTIRRFPRDMMVEGKITPQEGLEDIQLFLDRYPQKHRLRWASSHHERMNLRASLQPFPDLLLVMESLGDTMHLNLSRNPLIGTVVYVHA